MKEVIFIGDSLSRIKSFPPDARQDAGFQLDTVQRGKEPDDWKPMTTMGQGVKEIRIGSAGGQYRVIYLANLEDAVYVLHAFQKKTQQTRKIDIDLARKRLKMTGDQNG